jgi:hypothetical protein
MTSNLLISDPITRALRHPLPRSAGEGRVGARSARKLLVLYRFLSGTNPHPTLPLFKGEGMAGRRASLVDCRAGAP